MALNSRLSRIAEMVRKGDRVADIGTDHAYLPVYLVKSGISPFVYACDVVDGPLLNARKNIESAAVENICIRKGDGLAAVAPSEVDTLIIAGMGGDLIIRILEAAPWICNSRYEFLLQPMTSAEDLRCYLYENGFDIVAERAVCSQGRVYSVIKAVFKGKTKKCTPFKYYFGELINNISEDELVYIKRKRRILSELYEE
ncbi:MAG: SAM-dependent methyltransferase, partial [Clostridia bacterium]|nr:SAM-dependent methyltransferase [Clostridia bacterium]